MIETLTLGPVIFTAPLALLALVGLPILWFVLRATPPQPRTVELPSLALLDGIEPQEETPVKTPWWIILLRLAAVLLAILGLSGPIWSPKQSDPSQSKNDVIILMDNDWMAAPNWSAQQSAAIRLVSSLDNDQKVTILTSTSASNERDLAKQLSPTDAKAKLRTIRPNAWRADTAGLTEQLETTPLANIDVWWMSSGLEAIGHDNLTETLKRAARVSVMTPSRSEAIAIEALSTSSKGPVLSLIRSNEGPEVTIDVSAYDDRGRPVSSAQAVFEANARTSSVTFEIPEDLQAQIRHFKVLNNASAGGFWFWEGSSRTRRVGLLSGTNTVQPLLSDSYYVRKALSPFATIFEGNLDELLDQDLGAIILTDVGRLNADDEAELTNWVEDGGVLIRFAGPRLAAQSGDLLPVQLRRASRAFDSALSWDDPQVLDIFPEASPFALTELTNDVTIRRQVLAQPEASLPAKTWAKLKDGTPIVTAEPRGRGRLILFHVTAGPEWSDLPLSGVFVDMLRKITLPARELVTSTSEIETSLTPILWLDGFGNVISPASNAAPLSPAEFSTITPRITHPAGLYRSGAVTLPLNAGQDAQFSPISSWPTGFILADMNSRINRSLAGFLLSAALGLLLIDLVVALAISGKLPRLKFTNTAKAATGLMLTFCMTALSLPQAEAQNTANVSAPDAALELRFAYLQTGSSELDALASAGLRGLSLTLFRRTTVEPQLPTGVQLTAPELDLYPLLFILMPDEGLSFTAEEKAALSRYMTNGGAVLIDTRRGGRISAQGAVDDRLVDLAKGLDLPPLRRVDDSHVLTRAFYLLDSFTGKYADRPLWVESETRNADGSPRGDGISTLFITDADFASAWAVNENNRHIYTVDDGERGREMARRTGVNIVMYILTGNYKDDQVHIPSLLERLDQGITPTRPLNIRPDRSEDDQ